MRRAHSRHARLFSKIFQIAVDSSRDGYILPEMHRATPTGAPQMTNAQLSAFRAIADAMQSQSEPANWQWIGQHMSQRLFGITETRAKGYAERHGGSATKMA
jgi:hypothetical protein